MVPFILIAIFFIVYLELLGQWFLHKLNKNIYPFAFGTGFLLLMAYGYLTTSFISASRGSFYAIFAIYILFFVASAILIIKDIKKIKWNFKWQYWLVLIVGVFVLAYYAYNTTLGDLHGFDTVYYLNLITSNIGQEKLNFRDYITNGAGGIYPFTYSFQSYYYFISCFIFVAKKALSIIGIRLYYTQIIIWVFQLLFNAFFLSIILNTFDRFTKNKKLLNAVLLFLYIFYLGRQYYNNVFGFYGNTFRCPAVAYCVFFLYEYFNDSNSSHKYLFFISLIGMCSFSSSDTFIAVLLIFVSFFFMADKEDDLFRWYGISLLVPIATVYNIAQIYFFALDFKFAIAICLTIAVLNDELTKICRLKFFKKGILIVTTLIMAVLSYKVSGKLYNPHSFAWTNAELGDMTLNYFSFGYGTKERITYVYSVWLILLPALIIYRKNKLSMMCWILIICFFNPLCCSFIYQINVAYQRAYDIIINPFTLTIFAYLVIEKINNKYIYIGISSLALIFLSLNTDLINPVYYNVEQFTPSEDYDKVHKMRKAEYEMIEYIYEDYQYRGIESPLIVTPNILTLSSIPDGRYIYGRCYLNLYGNEGAFYQIYSVFYPYTYYGEAGQPLDGDYKNIKEYVEEAKVDYLVIDSDIMFHDIDKDEYYTLMYVGESITYSQYCAWPYYLFYTGK